MHCDLLISGLDSDGALRQAAPSCCICSKSRLLFFDICSGDRLGLKSEEGLDTRFRRLGGTARLLNVLHAFSAETEIPYGQATF